MLTLRFWKIMDGNRIETPAVMFTAVRQQGNMLYGTHAEKGEAAVAEAAKGLEPYKVTWLPMAPHFTSDKMLYFHGFEIKSILVEVNARAAKAALHFADLAIGEKFICPASLGDAKQPSAIFVKIDGSRAISLKAGQMSAMPPTVIVVLVEG